MKLIFSSPLFSLILIPSLVVSTLPAQSLVSAPTSSSSDLRSQNLTTPDDLQLRMIESDGPEAKVNSTPSKGFTVAVTNASGAAVPDAAVAVRLPDSGPTGTFADGSHSAVLYTDPAGRAQIHGLRWSQTPGAVVMRVTATKGSSHAALLMNETLTSDTATTVVEIAAPSSRPEQPAVPQPGQPAKSQAIVKTGAPAPSTAITPRPLSPTAATSAQPSVSVSGGSPEAGQHGSKTKWIILAAVVAGAAGGAFAFVGKGKSNPAPAQNGLTIGTPSISVGHP